MGIGISLEADVAARLSIEEVHSLVEKNLPLEGPLAALFSIWRNQSEVSCELLPLEEPVLFELSEGRLLVSAKTSSLGPGYHAALVESLDKMADAGDFLWCETDDSRDESGYFGRRDFADLQRRFSGYFDGLCRYLVNELAGRKVEGIGIGLPAGLTPKSVSFAATILGPRNLDFFRSPDPSRHFPWWDRGLTAGTREALAHGLGWLAFPWRAPLSGNERLIGDIMIRLAPAASWFVEVRNILAARHAVEPEPCGIGYLRGNVGRCVAGGWGLTVPGYFREALEDDGSTILFSGVDRFVRVSTFSLERKGPYNPESTLKSATTKFVLRKGKMALLGEEKPFEDQGFTGHLLSVQAEAEPGIAVVSIVYPSIAHRRWAKAVMQSIDPPQGR